MGFADRVKEQAERAKDRALERNVKVREKAAAMRDEKATKQAVRDAAASAPVALPLTVTSHDKGKNATVTLHSDRIERVLDRSALSFSKASQQAEVIPVATISSVASRKDGMVYTVVSAMTVGNSIDFRLAHADAAKFHRALTELVLAHHTPQAAAVAAPDLADQLSRLAGLRDSGVLTDEEFAAQKARLLAG